MNHLLESIVRRWPQLEPDQVYLVWQICRKHRLNPGMDLTIFRRANGAEGHVLQFGIAGLKRYVEATKQGYLLPPQWQAGRVMVTVSIPLQDGKANISASLAEIDYPHLIGRRDQLERRAWQVLLGKMFQPLQIDIERTDIISEPLLIPQPQDVVKEADRAIKTRKDAPQPPSPGLIIRPIRQRGVRLTIELATANLLSAMRAAHLLPVEGDERWAIDALLTTVYAVFGVESWSDGPMARQTAAQIVTAVFHQRGPSPVAATGDGSKLADYFMHLDRSPQPAAAA